MNINQWQEAVEETMQNKNGKMNTCIPGVIQSYKNGRAVVKPQGTIQYENGKSMEYPVIYDVPIVFPTGMSGTCGITFPIKSGDGCLIVFSQNNMQSFLSGTETDDQRHHSLNDAICIPGLYSAAFSTVESNPDDVCIFHGNSKVTLGDGGLNANLADGTIFELSGSDLKVNGISLTKHKHGGVQSGGSTTDVPQ